MNLIYDTKRIRKHKNTNDDFCEYLKFVAEKNLLLLEPVASIHHTVAKLIFNFLLSKNHKKILIESKVLLKNKIFFLKKIFKKECLYYYITDQ